MTSKRQRKQSPIFKRMAELVESPYRWLVLSVLVVAAFGGLWLAVWNTVRDRVLASDLYWLKIGQVEITPQPDWIHTDVREKAFRDASFDRPMALLEDDLTERIANAFKLHPWVEEVVQVRKYHPARVTVEIAYRKPVCTVQVPPQQYADGRTSQGGLLLVDAHGVLLPTEGWTSLEAAAYPRLLGIEACPNVPDGVRWRDSRVIGAAELATLLGSAWERLGLEVIVALPAESATRSREESFDLYTRGGTRIIWGRAPSATIPGELPAAEKLARLEQHVAKHGSLDGPNSPKELDLRAVQAIRTSYRLSVVPPSRTLRFVR